MSQTCPFCEQNRDIPLKKLEEHLVSLLKEWDQSNVSSDRSGTIFLLNGESN